MTIFLRNSKNETLVDIECNMGKDGPDVRCEVILKPYSELLLKYIDMQKEVINDFTEIQNIRQWFWEMYLTENDVETPLDLSLVVKKIILLFLSPAETKYNLHISID